MDDTGLYYFRARYYDPQIGHFISPDSIVPDATSVFDYNRYLFVRGNSLKYSDRDGHEPCPTGAWGDCLPNPHRNFVNSLANSRHQAGNEWQDLSAEMQTVLERDGLHEGVYNDLGGNTTAQTGWRDPATRLLWRLPSLLMGACADGDCTTEVNSSQQLQSSAKGLIGRDFETWLYQNLGGRGNFSINGREFDGAVGNRWYEAKSGQFWNMIQNNNSAYNKFLSDMGSRLKTAQSNGATYELHSNTPIPDQIKTWLTNKGIQYFEYLE